jgi:aspartate-semialdehyde dehydrogenase
MAIGKLVIVGAAGAVGRTLLELLEERSIAFGSITLLGRSSSVGETMSVGGQDCVIEELTPDRFRGTDVVVFCASADVSREFVPIAREAGALVFDVSSAFRMQAEVPLVVPPVNGATLANHQGLIAAPNCSAAILVTALAPLHAACPLERVTVCTYQAASGAGLRAVEELSAQAAAVLAGKKPPTEVLPHQLAFNVFSHESAVDETGMNLEERKVIEETRRILDAPTLPISVTCVRVPVVRAHTEAVHCVFREAVSVERMQTLLADAPGVWIVDDPAASHFPMPIEAANRNEVLVGRLRADPGAPEGRGLALLISGDQLRRGAALNIVEALEMMRH